MIDEEGRREAADILRLFKTGQITNDELERRWPRGNHKAVEEIRRIVWYMYDDLREHYYQPSPQADDLLRRCVDFLETEAEYRWPIPNPLLVLASVPLSVLTLGLANKLLWRKYDFPDYWPFATSAETESARRP